MAQLSRKAFLSVGDDDSSEQQGQQGQQGCDGVGGTPCPTADPGCCDFYDPGQLYAEWSTGSPFVHAFMKVRCVDGTSRAMCRGWSRITCAKFDVGTYNSTILQLFEGMSQLSPLKSMTIKKPVDGASPALARFAQIAEDIELIQVVFVRKLPEGCEPTRPPPEPCGCDKCNEDFGDIAAGGGPGGGRRRRRRRDCSRSCSSDSGIKRLFPFRQAMLRYRLFTSRIVSFSQVAGEQCNNQPIGCGTCNNYPGSLNPVTWDGGIGVSTGQATSVRATGVNFSEASRFHGHPPLANDQIHIHYASATKEASFFNPYNGCVVYNRKETIPS